MPPRSDILGLLYRDHHAWLQGWLTHRTGCRELAADLVQDTFLRVCRGRDVENLREPRAFLVTVAKGLTANWYRRQSLERAYLDSLAALAPEWAPSAEHQAIVREALAMIDAMLDGLPAPVRRVFLLAQFEGLGYADIGQRLGLSLSTVKRHMKRALVECLMHAP